MIFTVKIKGWLFSKGDEYDETINTHELGYKNNSFFYEHGEYTHRCKNNWGASSTGDLWYNFSLNVSMDIIVSNCGSSPKNYLLSILKSSQTIDYRSFNNETCVPGSNDAFIHLKNLIPGYRYSVISEGYEEDGYMSTSILAVKGGVRDIGLKNEPFKFENNHSINGDDNLIVYKLTLQKDMSLKVLTNGTGTGNRVVELLDFEKARDIYDKYFKEGSTAPSEDKSNLNLDFLPAGTHFILIKGGQNGDNFTVKIEGDRLYPPGTNDNNYMQVRRYTKEQRNTYLDEITYIDGLGRPMQIVQKGITPSGNDLVGYQEYDEFGRESQNWLPVYLQGNNGAFVPLKKIANNVISTVYSDDQNPFTKTVYEASPLNRILEQYSPGQDWHDNKKAVRTAYKTNVSENLLLNCILYKAGGTNRAPVLSSSGNYDTGLLYVTEVKDEDNNTSYEFKDKMGRIVLTRQMNGSETLDTYYVYNDYGNLCFVLPPLISTEGTGQAKLDLLAYLYKYDNRNRCVIKKLPGTDCIYYVYDKADRLIFTQDGEQRKKNEWTFTIPDDFGRVVLTGTCTTVNSAAIRPGRFDDYLIKAEFSTTGTYHGYNVKVGQSTFNELTIQNPVVHTASYYDSYKFRALSGFSADNISYKTSGEPAIYHTRYGTDASTYEHKGLLTGTATLLLDGSTATKYLYTGMYYDNKKQLIQSHSTHHLGGVDSEFTAYNFTGQPVNRKTRHTMGTATQIEHYTYSYDHAGRLVETKHKLNSGAEVVLARNEYDELGRLKATTKNDKANLKTTYAYNIRSWTKSISGPLFSQTLYYNDKVTAHNYSDYTPAYNGNISGMEWKTETEALRSYRFKYDKLSRLANAAYNGMTSGGDNNTSYSYDKHGNITRLIRRGKNNPSYCVVDDIALEYNGNQLKRATDSGVNIIPAASADFKDNKTPEGTIEYTYNANGAMNKDLNKGITGIQYNSLNLPQSIEIDNPNVKGRTKYMYTATGVKLQVIHETDMNLQAATVMATAPFSTQATDTKTTDYVGNKVYENGTLKRTLIDGGYIEGTTYHFFLTDHLGNNRVVAKADGTVIQKNHYYPFGMAFAENTTAEQGVQPYKYNGKELDQMHGLNMYDYSARFYEPSIGRFSTVDPRAEDDCFFSPYVYAYNNPLRFTDPTGMTPNDSIKDGGILNTITIEGTISAANTFAYYSLPMLSYADDADRAWNKGNYIDWIGNVLLGTGDGLLYFASLGSSSYIKGGSASLLKGTVKSGTRGLWVLSKKYAASIKSHSKWGTFYKSKSDGLWWVVDKTKHGGSEFKVFKETNQGLEWIHDADKYGDFISDKHKSATGTFISWGELKTVY